MNITNISQSLHTKINSSANLQEILILSKAIERLKIGNVKTVSTYADLLSLYPRKGEVHFVEDEEKLYYGFGSFWFSIFDTAETELYAWGSNLNSQLGDNTIVSKSSPVSVVGGFTDWVQASAGSSHSLGLRANGTLWAWGNNGNGQIGNNIVTTVFISSPVSVVGGFTDWIQASAGNIFSLGVRANGTLWAWGNNVNGQVGDNTNVQKSSPVSVVGGFTDWIQASAGGNHSLGVRANGTLWAWGSNANGVLGDNTIVNKSSPVSVVGGFTDWVQVSADAHSLGLRSNGTLWSWGAGSFGRLGDNTIVNKSSPVSVVGGFVDWIQASAGSTHSLGLRANGTIWAWGGGGDGRLGDNTTISKSSPVSIVGGFTDWVQASARGDHSLGVRANGTLWAWGTNSLGRLGDNTIIARSSPVSVVGGFTDWVQASAGTFHNLGLRSK
jgi:alpha-tubulin suppressor-like RCC1 family protein